jgi:hypothetical protein
MQVSSTMSSQSSSTAAPVVEKGVAGRINYAAWDKVATDLVQQVEQEDQVEIADQKAKVCLCECVCVSIDMCVFLHRSWCNVGSFVPARQELPQ